MWCYVVVQAIEALEAFPSSASRDLLRESILNTQFYYKVRVQAAHSLAKVCLHWLYFPLFVPDIIEYTLTCTLGALSDI